MPSINFIAAANAAIYCNAIPHFIDVEKNFPSIDAFKLEDYLQKNTYLRKKMCINKNTGRTIKALVFLHPFGLAGNIIKIKTLCRKFNIKIMEDAAESVGSFYKGKHLGTFAEVGILSFGDDAINAYMEEMGYTYFEARTALYNDFISKSQDSADRMVKINS